MSEKCIFISPEQYEMLKKELKLTETEIKAVVNAMGELKSTQEIKDFINETTSEERDITFEKKKPSAKMQNIADEITKMETIIAFAKSRGATPAQIKVIEKLIGGHKTYYNRLKTDLEQGSETQSVSVSNLKGSTPFKGDPTLYHDFTDFGSFMHFVTEELLGMGTYESYSDRFTKEVFDEMIEKFKKTKDLSLLTAIDKDSMFKMATEIVNTLNNYLNNGFIIIPEITVIGNVGKLDSNTKVNARIDMLAISDEGKLAVIDLKTKRVKGMTYEKDNNVFFDYDRALTSLSHYYGNIESINGKTFEDFKNLKRSTYDEWFVQLELYNNILIQNGFETLPEHSIFALIYDVSDNRQHMGQMFTQFTNHNYYHRLKAKLKKDESETTNLWYAQESEIVKRFDKLLEIVEKAVPTGKRTTKENVKQKIEDSYDLKPTELQMNNLINYVEKTLTSQIETLQAELQKLDKESSIYELKKKQLGTLRTVKKIITDKKDTGYLPDVYRGLIYANALQAISNEIGDLNMQLQGNIQNFLEKAKNGFKHRTGMYHYKDEKIYRNGEIITEEQLQTYIPTLTKGLLYKHRQLLNNNDNENSIKVYNEILQIYNQNKTFGELLQILSNIANEVKNNNIEVTEDSPIVKNIYKALSDYNYVNTLFKTASIPMIVNVLKSVGEKNFDKTKTELNQVLALRVEAIDKEIEDIQNGKYGPIKQLSQKIYSFFSKSDKQRLEELKNESNPNIAFYIEKLEKEKNKLLATIFDFNYDDNSLTKYVEAMSDPTSPLYMGARDMFQPSGFLSSLKPNQFQASITDQDLGIVSMMIVLKNSEAMANQEIVNDKDLHDLDRQSKQIMKDLSMTPEQLNSQISQTREVIYHDRATGEVKKTENILTYTKPYSVEYENTFKQYQALTHYHKEQVGKAKNEYFEAQKTKDTAIIADAKLKYDNAIRERDANTRSQITWMLENCNLPFIDEWYKKQIGLPEKYREKINDIYLEMYEINRQDPSLMSDVDYDQLFVLKAEIKKIKEDAKKENPEYAAILERMQDMYVAEIDYVRFDAFYKQSSLQLANFPEGWEKWQKIYTITKPTQEWYDLRSDIYEQLSELRTNDVILTDLYDQRRALLRPYYGNDGRINPRLVPSEVIRELDGIEAAIGGRINDLSQHGTKIDDATKLKIRRLTSRLDQLQQKVLSEHYKKDFKQRNEMLESLRDKYNESEDALSEDPSNVTLQQNRDVAEKNLMNFAEEYAVWFNERHLNATTVGALVTYGIPMLTDPKPFNYEYSPIDDRYIDNNVPNPDYFTTFNLKDEAKNPNFIESIEGIPMPKGIVQTGKETYSYDPNVNSKYIDPQFINIKNNSQLSQYYDTMTSYYFSLQNKMEGVKTGYNVPGFASTGIEDVYYNDLPTAVKKRFKQLEDRLFKLRGDIDATENVYGDVDGIRARFTRQLGEDLQTKDAIGALYKFATEAHYNKSMQMAKPQIEGFIEYVKEIKTGLDNSRDTNPESQRELDKRSKEYANMLSVLEGERDKFIKGQTYDPKNREVKKVINNLFMYVSMIRIGFDVTNQVKNYTAGSIQFWIAAGKAGVHYNDKDALYAYRKIFGSGGFMQHYLQDWGKISDIHESTMLYRIMNPLQKDMLKYVHEITGGRKRRLLNKITDPMELGYMLQDKGDTTIGLMTMYAVMNHYKYELIDPVTKEAQLDEKGNKIMVAAHDAYYKDKNGLLQIREDVNYNINDQLELKRIIIAEMRRAQGNYANSDQTRIERETMGQLMFFFRKFLVPLMLNRFGYLKPSWETGEAALGYWRALAQSFKYFGTKRTLTEFFLGFAPEDSVGRIGLKGVGKTIELKDPRSDKTIKVDSKSLYVRKIAQARRDSLAMIAMSLLASLTLIRLKDKDDDEISALEGNIARLIWLTKMEALSMFPFTGQSSQEYVKNFSTVIPFTKEATAALKAINHTMKYSLVMLMQMAGVDEGELYEEWYKDAFYARKSGAYEKGTLKLTKDLVDFTGIRNIRDIFQPENRLSQLKGKQ
ncbi:MAG: hypothetical protein EOL97_04630 [Spirochaetia bacterium]|nr:hypothetical protein [Spirochaetia bacterium]